MKKTVYLMRHGETLFNLRRRFQGWSDSPLTELGVAQAQAMGRYIRERGLTFDHVYVSTSERACDTLELMMDAPYTRLKALKEWNFGWMEGEPLDLEPPPPYGDFFKLYYHGEGEDEVAQRMTDALQELLERPGHQTVLAVSHGGSISCFYRKWAKNSPLKEVPHVTNCSLCRYAYENGEFYFEELVEVKLHP